MVKPFLRSLKLKLMRKKQQFLNKNEKDYLIEHFDSSGNLIYFEKFEGFWVKTEFDLNNDPIKIINSNGYVRNNYYKDGSLVSFEDNLPF